MELPLKYIQNPGVRQMCLSSVRRNREAASVPVSMFAEDQSTEKGGILIDQTVLVLYLHFPLCFG